MSIPLLLVTDIGEIYFHDEEGNTLADPAGSFEPQHFETFERIAEACNSFASLSAMNEAMRAVLSRIRNVVKHSSHTAGALSTIRAAVDALPPEVLP